MLLITTIPKSGTYLLSLFLQRVGVADSGLHFRNDRYWDFKNKPVAEIIADPNQYMHLLDLDQSMQLMNGSEFAVAHLHCNAAAKLSLQRFSATTFFMFRDLRDCLISHMRFVSDPRRRGAPPTWLTHSRPQDRLVSYMEARAAQYLKDVERQVGWILEPNVLGIAFEILVGDRGLDEQEHLLSKITSALNLSIDPQVTREILLKEVIGQPTRTFSGMRSSMNDYWSADAEALFREHQGIELNRMLGYD